MRGAKIDKMGITLNAQKLKFILNLNLKEVPPQG
jgi:hypothetical protein